MHCVQICTIFSLILNLTLANSNSRESLSEEVTDSCRRAYFQRIEAMCKYPDQLWPCFKGSRFLNGQIHHIYDIDGIATQACLGTAGAFSLGEIFKNVCCFSPNCLEKCYGIIPDLDNNLFIKANLLATTRRHSDNEVAGAADNAFERRRANGVSENGGYARPRRQFVPPVGPQGVGAPRNSVAESLRDSLDEQLFQNLLHKARNSQRNFENDRIWRGFL